MSRSLASLLDNAAPRRASEYQKQHVDRILDQLAGKNKKSFEAALSDVDSERRAWRISNPELARVMTEAGFPLSEASVRGYRAKHYPNALNFRDHA